MKKKKITITCIKSDHGKEYENQNFDNSCSEHRIEHIFLAPRTPQQNKVIKRKNRTLLNKMAITMLNENDLPKYILVEMVNTTCYVLNRVLLRLILKKTLYEL